MKELLPEQEGEVRPRRDFPAFEEAIWDNQSPNKNKTFQEEICCPTPATLKGSLSASVFTPPTSLWHC